MRPQIYQLMVRHFSNVNPTRKPHGTLAENGCGKFNEITSIALEKIKNMGFSHIWFTGILEHASSTDYPNRKADPACLLKGKAGSPYAIRDYFDVSCDLAVDPEQRLLEFRALLERCKKVGLIPLIDFIPNHVARSYVSLQRPDITFGIHDNRSRFFYPNNNYFYLRGDGELKLPDDVFSPETNRGRVTGNNAATWSPSVHDWYETVKLNYGHDYRLGTDTSDLEARVAAGNIPDTWQKMNAVLAFWQSLGVRGFRCDMAHMVPVCFWQWLISHARQRDPSVYFTGEAYDLDPAKLTNDNVLHALLDAGYDSVYDSETYDIVKGIYEHGKWANDIDELLWDEKRLHAMLRYAENHDEVRIASPKHWGNNGAKVGKPATAVLSGIGRSAHLLYSGQEVGEPAIGSEGFSGDDGRTSIFDYYSPPEMAKWVNGGKFDGALLNSEQQELREWYQSWFQLMQEPAFAEGEVYGLNGINLHNPDYGRLGEETCSGHWLYAYLRYTESQIFLIVVNFNPLEALHNINIQLPEALHTALEEIPSFSVKKLEPCAVMVHEF